MLAPALIERILAMPGRSAFFEDVALHLLTALGYGNGLDGAAARLGRTGDGGVDAVILLDPLGLDRLYVQAKCHVADNLVDAPMVRDFAGSLEDKKTARGALITTSGFTRGAADFVRRIHRPIALIDGAEVARLMIKHGVGVKQEPTTGMKEVDEGYFGGARGGP
jgi:restriction system protein